MLFTALGFRDVTRGTQGLEVLPIPKERRIPVMLANVVDLEGLGNLPALGTRIRLRQAHLLAQAAPRGCGIAVLERVDAAAASSHQVTTAGVRAVVHAGVTYPVTARV